MKKILLTILAVVLVVALGATMVGCSAPAAEPSESASAEASTAPESSAPAEESPEAGAKDSYTFGYIAYNTADIWND